MNRLSATVAPDKYARIRLKRKLSRQAVVLSMDVYGPRPIDDFGT